MSWPEGSYDVHGSGPAVVLLHGMMMDRQVFEPQISALARGHCVVAADLRARRDLDPAPYDLYDLTDDLVALLDQLVVEQCVLVGMSMGGYTGIRAALRRPDRVRGLVLIGAAVQPFSSADRDRWEAYYGRHRDDQHLPRSFATREAEGHFASRTRRDRADLVRHWTDRIASRSGRATYLETLAWARQDDVRHAWSGLDLPVLVVHGDEDEAVPLQDAIRTYQTAKHARLLVIPFAGHALTLEQPEIVNAALSQFLDETAPAL